MIFPTANAIFGDRRRPTAVSVEHLKYPAYWLLAVAGSRNARRLFAAAPETIAPGALSANARRLCGLAGEYCADSRRPTAFINDIAHMLGARGQSWDSCAVDWKAAVAELRANTGSVAALSFALGEDAYVLAAYSAAPTVEVVHPGGVRRAGADERRAFRMAVEALLRREWPGHVEGLLATKSVDFAAKTHAFDGNVA